jgi:cytochrome b6-f complex iron-sulfur subunit
MADEAVSETAPKTTPINRREFLNFAWLASLGYITVSLAGVTFLFAMPRFREGEFGGIYTVGPVANLPNEDDPPENHPKVKIWLSNSSAGVMALYKVCTHLGCLYGWNNQENKFICPCHGSQFQKNGDYIEGPAPRALDRFVVQVTTADGDVITETDPLSGGPVPLPDDPNLVIRIDTGRRIDGPRHG